MRLLAEVRLLVTIPMVPLVAGSSWTGLGTTVVDFASDDVAVDVIDKGSLSIVLGAGGSCNDCNNEVTFPVVWLLVLKLPSSELILLDDDDDAASLAAAPVVETSAGGRVLAVVVPVVVQGNSILLRRRTLSSDIIEVDDDLSLTPRHCLYCRR